jgi:hypothetical protein
MKWLPNHPPRVTKTWTLYITKKNNKDDWMVLETLATEVSSTPTKVVVVWNKLGSNSISGNNGHHGTCLSVHILHIIGQDPMLQTKLSNQDLLSQGLNKSIFHYSSRANSNIHRVGDTHSEYWSTLFVFVHGQRRNITYDIQ